MAQKNVGRIPVVRRVDKNNLVGILTRKNIITTYNKALDITMKRKVW